MIAMKTDAKVPVNCSAKDMIPYIDIRSTKWLYRGEGNANLVISLPLEKVIIRLEKCCYDLEKSSEIITMRENKLINSVLFHKMIVVPFIGKVFLQPPSLARISKEDIAFLDEELIPQRPKYRLEKEVRYEMITVLPDYTYLSPLLSQHALINEYFAHSPTYCVEIKPKQGWVYPGDRFHPKCTYCLNQYLKVKKKRVLRISKYCPLDLFSGDVQRMKKSIRNLLLTPQNNLKIFKNGDLVYGDEVKGNYMKILKEWLEPEEDNCNVNNERLLEKWTNLLTNALLKELTEELPYSLCLDEASNGSSIQRDDDESPLAEVIDPCDWSAGSLPDNCVLQRILILQKLQDTPFPELYRIYCQKRESEGDYCYVDRLLHSDQAPGPLEKYLLSTTAKDCSIFLAFQPTRSTGLNGPHYIKDSDGVVYCMNIGISDIDPKPLSCIEKHYKRDIDTVSTILNHIGKR